jgi:hypothetical protein
MYLAAHFLKLNLKKHALQSPPLGDLGVYSPLKFACRFSKKAFIPSV